ncbi:MAG: FadR family transcriptional regulator [Desulfobacterales bacterium]|nr:MAG: FadR family transcriptional regulator [Desulfobacterales bacterium]
MSNKLKLKALNKKKLYEEIISQIEVLIKNGNLKQGDQLPPERKLAESFRVSRNSVREAIRALEEKRILESRPGDGTYVILKEEDSLIKGLAFAIQREKDKLQEIFEFRRMIEPQICALAAANATKSDILKMKKILEKQEINICLGRKAIKEDSEFHLYLAKASKNSIMLDMVNILNSCLNESRSEFLQSEERRIMSLQAHQKILKAIEKKSPDAAWQAMSEHVLEVEKIVSGNKNLQILLKKRA